MNIAVVVRQVPDLIEVLDIDSSGSMLDWDSVSFIVNECDDHAVEQALLLKEAGAGSVTVVALDWGDIDNTLYTAAAKGADKIIKIPIDDDLPPTPRAAAAMYAAAIQPLDVDLVLVGVQAHDELDGVLAPTLANVLNRPYVGIVRGVSAGSEPDRVVACKEFPGAVLARMEVRLPAVLGILGADQPPRYVPVSRIRAAMSSAEFEEPEVAPDESASLVTVRKLYPPESGKHAEMLTGSEEEVAQRVAEILAEKGLL